MKEDSAHLPSDPQSQSERVLVHDLRNAIAPIRNAVHLLRLRGGADADLASIAGLIERQVDEVVKILDGFSKGLPPRCADPGIAANGGDRPAAAPPGKRILLVDDNAALLASLSAVLREAGHEVQTAADGAGALALAPSWNPNFVLLDAHLPRMNGFEVARELRAMFPQGVMKLILMSGSQPDETTLQAAKRAGFDHYLDKIHDFATLEKLLRGDA